MVRPNRRPGKRKAVPSVGTDTGSVLHIRLRRDSSGYPPFEAEEVAAKSVGEHLFELTGTPAFAFGLALGDVVRTRHFEGSSAEWVDQLVAAGGHSTVRVIALGAHDTNSATRIAEARGCTASETAIDGLVAIDVPPDVDFPALFAKLKAERELGQLDISVGVLSDEHAAMMGDEPLD